MRRPGKRRVVLSGEKILVTGPAGQIAFPLARYLARENEVWGIARFGDSALRAQVEDAGITTRVCDLGDGDLAAVPDDFSYVLHLAVFLWASGAAPDPESGLAEARRGLAEAV